MSIPSFVRVLFALLPIGSLLVAAPGEPPDVRATSVTIPYAELRSLWDAAHVKPPEKPVVLPPLTHSVSLARYAFKMSPDPKTIECRATFEVTNFGDGWTEVPLLPAEVRIESIAPETTVVSLREGFYTLLLNGPGKRVITIQFAARLANATGTAPNLRLAIPPALMAETSFTGIPVGSDVELVDGVRVAGSSATPTMFRLGPAPVLAFTVLRPDRRSKKATVPATWNAHGQTIVFAEEGRTTCRSRIMAEGVDGDTAEMRIVLPATANVREVESANLERWETTRSDDGLQRVVALRWNGPECIARDVMVVYELPLIAREGEWTLTAPLVKGAIAQRSAFFVVTRSGLEITAVVAADPGANAGLNELGAALSGALGGSSFVTIYAAPGEVVAAVKVKRLPLLATAQARIDDAQFQMRVVADGSLLTEAKFMVRHDRPQVLRLELPMGSDLLACSVNEVDVNPIDRGDGRLEISMPSPPDAKPTRVMFSYSARGEKLAPVAGQVELVLPRTELFTSLISWQVQLPGAYELTAFEGNVDMASAARPPGDGNETVVRLRKELCKGEAPRVALFYRKRAVTP